MMFDDDLAGAENDMNNILARVSGTALAIMDRIRDKKRALQNIASALSNLDAPWADAATQRLRNGIQKAEIRREDREGNILLGIPQGSEHAVREWLDIVRRHDENPDWLFAATRYALERLRALTQLAEDVAGALPTEALSFTAQLRGIAASQD